MKKWEKVKWEASQSAPDSARAALPAVVAKFFDAGRKAAAPNTSWKRLHQFRLHSKRFRYTLELFRPLYGPGLESRLALLRKLQTHLGDISDFVTASEVLQTANPRKTPQSARILSALNRRARAKKGEFLQYWKETFDAPDEEKRWISYLSKPNTTRKSKGSRKK